MEASGTDQAAYGHPVVAFFHVFWKVAAAFVYLFGSWIGAKAYIVDFVGVVVLLMVDFWTTKNVAGRLLVGLRWWNEVTDEGSNWRFESLPEGSRQVNKKDSRVFWWTLYITPLVWVIFGIFTFFQLEAGYLLLVVVAVVLSCSNVYGYVKCSREAQKHLHDMAQNALGAGIAAAMSRV